MFKPKLTNKPASAAGKPARQVCSELKKKIRAVFSFLNFFRKSIFPSPLKLKALFSGLASASLFPKIAVIFSSLGLIALFWPAFRFWSPLLYLLVLAAILILISYREDISIPLISSLLKQEYFKTKFRINRQENELSTASKINKAGKMMKIAAYYSYLKILYYLIILFKSSRDSFAAVREEAQDIYKELIRITNKKDSGEDEIIDIEIIKERLARGQTVDPRILDKIEQELFALHKRQQKKATVFSLSGLSVIIAATVVVSLALNLVLPSLPFTRAATYAWMQSSWTGGADIASTASHNTDQSTWTKYYSASSTISAGAAGVALSGTTASTTETTDSDFNAGATSTGYIYVASGTMTPKKPNGYACTVASDCTINSCIGGLCQPPCGGIASITDTRDTNNSTYNTVEIGTQCWLARNSNVGILLAGTSDQTNNAVLEKYCYSDTEANCTTDGGLYQWAEAMQYKDGCSNTASLQPTEPVQGICPTGWHIPTDAEQYTLENYLKIAGQTCDAARVNAWDCNDAGTDMKSSGSPYFYAPLAGYRSTNGSFYYRAALAGLWSSTQDNATAAWARYLYSSNAAVYRDNDYRKASGFSVRCLKN